MNATQELSAMIFYGFNNVQFCATYRAGPASSLGREFNAFHTHGDSAILFWRGHRLSGMSVRRTAIA